MYINIKCVCVCVCVCTRVCVQSCFSCVQLCDPMDCIPPGSSVHGVPPGKNTGVGCHFLLQGIFLTQGSNLHLQHWHTDSLLLHHLGSPILYSRFILKYYIFPFKTSSMFSIFKCILSLTRNKMIFLDFHSLSFSIILFH